MRKTTKQKVEVDTKARMVYNYGVMNQGVDCMDENRMFEQIVNSYEHTQSVKDTASELGVSRNTVQRVLITEGLWESKRSKEVVALFKEGYSAQEISERLMLSLKCVQNYLPYTKGMRNEAITDDSVRSKNKRERMKKALENQRRKLGDTQINNGENNDVIMIDESLNDNKGAYERMERIILGEPVRKEDRPAIASRKYIPSVLKLHLELVDYRGQSISFTKEEQEILRTYAKCNATFSREVLVPAEMSLRSLNYMIQRLFGWQNSHLHSFVLEDELFDRITNGGNLDQWENLCGVLFRYPDEDYIDRYCADDYDGYMSFKTWLKIKYSGAQIPFSVGDSYIENKRLIEELEERISVIKNSRKVNSVKEVHRCGAIAGEYDALLERMQLNSIFYPKGTEFDIQKWLDDTQVEINQKNERIAERKENEEQFILLLNSLRELRHRRVTQSELERVIKRGADFSKAEYTSAERAYYDNSKIINYYQEECNRLLSSLEPKVNPFTDSILYRYDFGDDWCVKVTCVEGYYINDCWDYPNEQGWITIAVREKDRIEDWDFYNCSTDEKVIGSFAEELRDVTRKKLPICTDADGIRLLDDVGGIYGFIDMLKVIHGEDSEEAIERREWAKSQGWTGRPTKIKNML